MSSHPSRHGNSCNFKKGEGETSSAVRINPKNIEPESLEIVVETETPNIPERGSVARPLPIPPPNPTQIIILD